MLADVVEPPVVVSGDSLILASRAHPFDVIPPIARDADAVAVLLDVPVVQLDRDEAGRLVAAVGVVLEELGVDVALLLELDLGL